MTYILKFLFCHLFHANRADSKKPKFEINEIDFKMLKTFKNFILFFRMVQNENSPKHFKPLFIYLINFKY
jgi:hypothetical protein